MRFMLLAKECRDTVGTPPSPELVAAIGRLSEEMTAAGVLLDIGGLLPSAAGARVHAAQGTLSVTDGPFVETKELIGGYAIIRADSKEEAIEHGKRFLALHVEVLGQAYQGELEIRQLMDGAPEPAPAEQAKRLVP